MNVETELEIYRLVFASKAHQHTISTALAIYGGMKPKTRQDFRLKQRIKKLMEEKVKQTDGWYIPGGTDPLTPSQRSKYEKGLSPYRRDVITGKYEVNKGKYV